MFFLLAYALRLHGREEVEVGNCETPTGFHWPLQLLIGDYNTIFLSLTSYNMVVGGLAVIYMGIVGRKFRPWVWILCCESSVEDCSDQQNIAT